MTLSLNEIRSRALEFSNNWKDETSERAEAQTFWNEFFEVFGLNRRRLASFEESAKRINGNGIGRIDLFWKGMLIAEHKSAGKDLDSAFTQATDYFHGLKDAELPGYIIVSDFAKIRLYNLEENTQEEFQLSELASKIEMFGFISGYKKHKFEPEDPANIQASVLMGKFHDSLKESGYTGSKLEVFLVRILFVLFADDTLIWEKGLFHDYILNRTNPDGTDLGGQISKFFRVLNTPENQRSVNLDEDLQVLSYINGGLFAENIEQPDFNSKMRLNLLECCKFDWSVISPAVFGSLFQNVMKEEDRRTFGAHYTEEKNILKTIKPLFLDNLQAELNKIKNLKLAKRQKWERLFAFQQKLASLTFFDPACGCGNFLVISYREIRKLELDVLKNMYQGNLETEYLGSEIFSKVNVDQFYGIEIEEFPAKIAETAMWLTDHQMNLELSAVFGYYYARLPLTKSAKIVHENSLRTNWKDVVDVNKLNYILGNPPFVGSRLMNSSQKEELTNITNIRGVGNLDYVTAWYFLAAKLLQENPKIEVGFVSTNSISQGEQTGILWGYLFSQGISISFAHQTFKWSSQARGAAAVYCIIVGFKKVTKQDEDNLFLNQDLEEDQKEANKIGKKRLFVYENVSGEPLETYVENINGYLVAGENIIISGRSEPVCKVPKMIKGNLALDYGHLIFTNQERGNFILDEPNSAKWFKRFLGGNSIINSDERYCLWLKDISPSELMQLPKVLELVEKVKKSRLAATAISTHRLAETPYFFSSLNNPEIFLAIPETSSENREYIPFAFFDDNYIPNNTCYTIPNASLYHFGILTSKMHIAWVKYVCGRLKSDYRYSKDIVYNNFVWPGLDGENAGNSNLGNGSKLISNLDANLNSKTSSKTNLNNLKLKTKIEELAQNILDIRKEFTTSTLADLYNPLSMPPSLRNAHNQLDKTVESAYLQAMPSFKIANTDSTRMQLLFEMYKLFVEKV